MEEHNKCTWLKEFMHFTETKLSLCFAWNVCVQLSSPSGHILLASNAIEQIIIIIMLTSIN